MPRRAIGETPEEHPIDQEQALDDLALQLRAFDLTPEELGNVLYKVKHLVPRKRMEIGDVNPEAPLPYTVTAGYAGKYHLSITVGDNGRYDLKVFEPKFPRAPGA